MSSLPSDHPIVTIATDALVEYAGYGLSRSMAATLLGGWQHAGELTDREFRSVLLAFPADDDLHPDSWLSDERLMAGVAR